MNEALNSAPHRRYNILTGEWVLVSPHRTQRPWQGKTEETTAGIMSSYDPSCYLCPGNTRSGGEVNPDYKEPFSFKNDFPALLAEGPAEKISNGLLQAESETGICKVVCFSPDHSLTLPVMKIEDITKVIQTWKKEYLELGALENINYVQVFENKGEIMGCSNPHPHGQIWAQRSIPTEVLKKTKKLKEYWNAHKKSLLTAYLDQELEAGERIVLQNEHFVALVPYWAVWPYEVMILPRTHYRHIGQLNGPEEIAFAQIIKALCIRYDNLFETSFPYSSGIHQQPTGGEDFPEWHFHMSFYPPLLRSASIKKFMVGYELFASPQRDITAEQAAQSLRELPDVHFSVR
ncbi:UDP-glucose--hexose-1-phosphate uridylyltransferase [Antarcticibacterium arcticum]|uniref:Galactose-1-phosphate uridylyltransferase n=1 Tax=Antarcticibacterium arcticum TaxID=2585771 RepID=A0A5B8YJ58_9FLAO|nr:UDP-glucose--hexose-1-phosphate uridylyltransferase [Antarcticibacterium arcticum]QED36426.1 UDP-glucose--hexose-1-phosphate uridylyltransferase [Antarcticibacterium arcticum]